MTIHELFSGLDLGHNENIELLDGDAEHPLRIRYTIILPEGWESLDPVWEDMARSVNECLAKIGRRLGSPVESDRRSVTWPVEFGG